MLDLTNINTIKSIMKENRLWAKKSFGQHFLISPKPLMTLMRAANVTNEDTVVEVGPGLGVLTQELVKKAKLVLAIEKDYGFVQYLRKYFKHCKNVKIIHADILDYDLSLMKTEYKVVSNLPYNITSPTIRKFLECNQLSTINNQPSTEKKQLDKSRELPVESCKLESMIIMVQKEVAERICAKAGNSERGLLTLMVEFHADAEIVEVVDRKNFWPVPEVDSAIIKITLKHENNKTINPDPFFRIVKIGFSQKRRQIVNPLSAGLRLPKNRIIDILKSAKIDYQKRAEDLTLEDWKRLMEGVQNG